MERADEAPAPGTLTAPTDAPAAGTAPAEPSATTPPADPAGRPAPAPADDDPAADPPAGGPDLPVGERTAARALLAALLLPFVVSALALLVTVGGDYMPAADHALTEMQIRDVGREPVLVGLFSRDEWNHPGPSMFYLLAPVYRVLGSLSIGMNIGTLAINGAAVAGMALIARRRGGVPLMLLTVLGSGLLMRALGAEFVHDPWNCFITALPYGLLIFLTWEMTCGTRWALPVAAGVATFLAQTHVGFVPLALPLLALGAGALALQAWRDRSDREARRPWLTVGLVTAGVLGVMWLPPLVDVLTNAPSNLREVADWFSDGSDESKTLGDGLRVIGGQFGGLPEWLVTKKDPVVGGESPFMRTAPLPWLLVPVVAGAVVLWRRGGDGRKLVAVLGVTLLVGVVSVARTVGAAFDYRLRWTWVPPMIAAVVALWALWKVVAERWPSAQRAMTGAVAAGVVVVTGVNVVTAATAGTPQEGDSAALEAIMPGVLDAVEGTEGQVFVGDVFANGSWYARGVVLQLERAGYDARVDQAYDDLFGESRVVEGTGDVRIWVGMDQGIEMLEAQPNVERIASWVGISDEVLARGDEEMANLEEGLADGDLTPVEFEYGSNLVDNMLHDASPATAFAVAVFLEDGP